LAKADLLSKELSTAVDLRREKKQNEWKRNWYPNQESRMEIKHKSFFVVLC
jgi:hypothetical protein